MSQHTMSETPAEFVTFRLAHQWIGIPVLMVQEVLMTHRIARVPLAQDAIPGLLNLRGQIVTAVDLRTTLGLPARAVHTEYMNVVVRYEGELFAFMVDDVGDVVTVAPHAIEPAPPTLDERWRAATSGIVRRERDLLVVMNVPALLKLELIAV
ncbi:chemotaxis protein CheW [Gemmatimonas sp.]|jgi:purine-binding chemotaxis protein CheW|uniref:chemotaxis protein CheW n=1 Tax=Gemmatimonas sp. TaxID=1962908 RepID=UPI0031BBFCB8|nr:chemotaxis protein [Gemmatimonas sp.]